MLPRPKKRPKMGVREPERVKDQPYLDFLKTEPCLFTGFRGHEYEGVDPAHIGTYGKGAKTDDEAIPLRHSIHQECHQQGEMTTLKELIPDWLLRDALRAYARQLYRDWRGRQT